MVSVIPIQEYPIITDIKEMLEYDYVTRHMIEIIGE